MKKIYFLLIFITSITFGQTYSIDNTFNPSDTGVYSQYIGKFGALLNNGKILTTVGQGDTNIYRLNSDGSLDSSFALLSIPYRIEHFFANKMLGNFITVKGDIYSDNTTLKSYDANGIIISSFTSPTFTKTDNLGGAISKIFFLSDGKFLIFGQFNFVNGVSYNNIVRLNADGSVDTGFSIGTGFSGSTTAFAIQSDGKYVVGGDFGSYNEVSKGKIARLNSNGLLDTSFNVNTLYNSSGIFNGYGNGPINDIIIQPDGKIITSGASLYSGGSQFRKDIVRLNSNGSTDTTFNYYMNFSGLYIRNLLYNSDGSIFFKLGTTVQKCNNSGSMISTFNDTNAQGDADFISEGTMLQQNNKLVVVGNYKNGLGITRLGYHRLNLDGTIDLTFNPHFGPNIIYFGGLTNTVSSNIYNNVLPDNKILLYGGFTTYNDSPVKSIIRLNENGEIDTNFNISSLVNSTMIHPTYSYEMNPIQTKKDYDGKLYIKGDFTQGFQPTKHIIKLNYDGSIDSNFNFYDVISGFKITNDNKIIAIGTIGGVIKIIRYNSDCTVDNTFASPTFAYGPNSIELLDDNKILVSLGNHKYNNNYLIRLNENGSLDNTFSLLYYGYNIDGVYKTKTINGKTYVSGKGSPFPPYNGSSFLMRYNTDWTIDNTFVPIATNNYKFLSNERTITDSPTVNNYKMYRINDSNGNQLSAFSSGIEDGIEQILNSQNCENLLFCGKFYKVNNLNKHNISRLTVPGSIITPTPTGEINQLFSQGQTLADLIVNGQNIQWYDSQSECAFNALNRNSNQLNSVLPINTILTNGITYYASQIINGVESNHRLPVTATMLLGVNDFVFSNYFSVYPNPVSDVLTIAAKENISVSSINIYNTLGQLVLVIPNAQNTKMVDVSALTTGNYFIKINSDKGTLNTKFIKK